MKSILFILLMADLFTIHNSEIEQIDLCEIVRMIESAQPVDLKIKGQLIGDCRAVIYETRIVKDVFNVGSGNYNCDSDGHIAVLSEDGVFAENVRYAIQLDKVSTKKGKTIITYSIVEFFHTKQRDANKNILLSNKLKIKT